MLLAGLLPSASGYLLLAQPQSSSTSTLQQLGHMAALGTKQVFPCSRLKHVPTCTLEAAVLPCEYPLASAFRPLADQHSDVCEVDTRTVAGWVRCT